MKVTWKYQWIMSWTADIHLLFWNQQQMHHPQSMQQTYM